MCNDVLRKPAGMTEDECRDLHIHRDDTAVWSFWKPNPEELLALKRGGAVALIVMGATHPPLSIMATHPTEPQEPRPVDESEYRHRMDAVNARLNALVALTKQIVASWTSNTDDSPKRRGLIDRFLDLLNANKTDGSLVQPVQVEDEPGVTQADIDRYRADAEGWKAEAERFELRLREVSTALGDDWNVMPPDQAITVIKNRLAMAEAARDEWERRAKQYRGEVMILEAVVDRVKEAINPNPAEG